MTTRASICERKRERKAGFVALCAFVLSSLLVASAWGEELQTQEPSEDIASASGRVADEDARTRDVMEREISDGEAPSLDEARAAFREGLERMEDSEWEAAAESFSYAARGKNTPGLLYYVGYSRERGGKLVEALEAYRSAIVLLKSEPSSEVGALVPVARSRVLAVVPQVQLLGLAPEARLVIDGAEVAARERLLLNPGEHEVWVTRDKYEVFHITLILALSATEVVDVRTKRLAAPAETGSVAKVDEKKKRAPSGWQRGVFWGSVGVGVVGLGVGSAGVVMRLQSSATESRVGGEIEDLSGGSSSACVDPLGDLKEHCDELSAARARRDTGTALLVGGAIGAAAGTVGALLSHYFWPEPTLALQVSASKSRAGILISGEF